MIQPNELRIGNLIQLNPQKDWYREGDLTIVVESISNEGINYTYFPSESTLYWESLDDDKFVPIALTPEWLDRFGFEYEKQTIGGWERWQNKRIKLLDKKFSWGPGEYSPYIQYVHQLQNLYFCLCGEELTTANLQQSPKPRQ